MGEGHESSHLLSRTIAGTYNNLTTAPLSVAHQYAEPERCRACLIYIVVAISSIRRPRSKTYWQLLGATVRGHNGGARFSTILVSTGERYALSTLFLPRDFVRLFGL